MNCRGRNNPDLRSEPSLQCLHLQSVDRQQTDCLIFCIICHIVECIILHTWVGFIFMVIVLVVVMQIFEKVKEQLLKWTID